MQTVEWTDGKLEERLDRIDERFDEVNRRIKESREETARRFDEVDRRLAGIEEMRQEITTLHTTFQRGNATLIAAVIGVIGAVLAKGG